MNWEKLAWMREVASWLAQNYEEVGVGHSRETGWESAPDEMLLDAVLRGSKPAAIFEVDLSRKEARCLVDRFNRATQSGGSPVRGRIRVFRGQAYVEVGQPESLVILDEGFALKGRGRNRESVALIGLALGYDKWQVAAHLMVLDEVT